MAKSKDKGSGWLHPSQKSGLEMMEGILYIFNLIIVITRIFYVYISAASNVMYL